MNYTPPEKTVKTYRVLDQPVEVHGYTESQRRAELMPTEQDAAKAMWDAWYRLKELGWKETRYGPTNEVVQLIEPGSSGIHKGSRWNEWPEKTWWIDNDYPSNPCLFKPLDKERGEA